jgi:hypothetical protein
MKGMALIWCCALFLGIATGAARGEERALSDEEMDLITAGSLSASVTDGKLGFLMAGNQGRVTVQGDAAVSTAPNSTGGPTSAIILRDNAQSNLQALVNVNAVNSKVQVLINLNVNINSSVGAVYQTNSAPSL